MSAVLRAAEVIRSAFRLGNARWHHNAAQALIDAGWHDGPMLSDADRAVLDTAEALTAWWDSPPDNEPIAEHFEPLLAAVRARRETQP